MAYGDYDNDYDGDYGNRSNRYGSSSRSGSRYGEEEPENKFSNGITRLLRLPPELSTAIDGIAAKIKSTIIDSGGDKVHAYALSLAEMFAKTSVAKKIGFTNTKVAARTAEAIFSLGIAVGDKFIGYKDATQNYYKDLRQTAKSISPVLSEIPEGGKSGKASVRHLLHVQDNEVITFKRQQIYNLFKGRLTASFTSTLDAIPILLPELEKRRRKAQADVIAADPNAHLKVMKAEFDNLDDSVKDGFNNFRDYVDYKRSYNPEGYNTRLPNGEKGLGKWVEEWGPLIGGAGLSAVARRIAQNAEQKFNKPCALDMIIKLRDELKDNPKSDSIEGKSLNDYVVDIFQQNQRDHHRALIGSRFQDSFQPVVGAITDAIKRGRMDPLALVRLVGENKIVKKSGKSFATEKELDWELKRQMDTLPASIHADLNTFYAEAPFTQKDVVSVLGQLKGEERAFFASLFPDTVLEKGGMKAKEIHECRKQLGEHYFELLATAVQDLSQLSDDQLKEKKLTDQEITKLRDVAEQAKTMGEKAVFDAVGEPGEEGIEAVVRNAGMSSDKIGFWTDLIKRNHAAKEKAPLEAAKDGKKEDLVPPPASHTAKQEVRESNATGQAKDL